MSFAQAYSDREVALMTTELIEKRITGVEVLKVDVSIPEHPIFIVTSGVQHVLGYDTDREVQIHLKGGLTLNCIAGS